MEHLPKMNHLKIHAPIELTYICKLVNKNLLHHISYLVSDLTRHKKFTTSNMFKYISNRLPY
jgi:hypothetical protein